MISSMYLVQRRSDGKWLSEFGGWMPWQDNAKTFANRWDAEREARRKADGDFRIVEFAPSPFNR